MKTFVAILCLLASFPISIFVMTEGWGLEVNNWWAIIIGWFVNLVLMTAMHAFKD